jgi:hypothetical protein
MRGIRQQRERMGENARDNFDHDISQIDAKPNGKGFAHRFRVDLMMMAAAMFMCMSAMMIMLVHESRIPCRETSANFI